MAAFDTRTHPWDAGHGGIDAEPCTAQPPRKYVGRYIEPSSSVDSCIASICRTTP